MINPISRSQHTAPFSESHAPGNAISKSNADPAGFASLLRQRQPAPTPPPSLPAAAPAAPKPTSGSTEPHANTEGERSTSAAAAAPAPKQPEAPPPHDPSAQPRASANANAKASTKAKPKDAAAPEPAGAHPTAAQAADAAETATDADAAPGAAGKPAATAAALDPSLMPWLAGLQRTPTTAASGGIVNASTPGTGDPAAKLAAGDAHAAKAGLQAQNDLQAKAPFEARPADNVATFAALLDEQPGTPTAAGAHGTADDGVKNAVAAASAAANGAAPAPTAGAATAPTPVTVATPVNAPDFAHELGLHLAVLAKDGVQQAELHLNPADMGPVSVHIVMDGTQAHVAFGADLAATRQVIEAGLPQLAGALADAGFTLAGGGVSEHAGGRSGGGRDTQDGNGGRPRAVSAASANRVGTSARQIVRQGGVDLFA